MESLLAIGVGLVLRVVVDVATENDNRVGGVLVGLWEGVVLNHFVRRMPHSFDPYLGLGFRIFVDFLFTQSLSRLALVALWALVGMLLADIAPNVWHESGLRHVYRQVRKDVRHVQRSVPHIRIKNDLPSVRLFAKSRSSSGSSIRSDRAAPSRSQVPSRAPTPGPSRRPGPSPPGTFPDVSGWSETNSDVSHLRERFVTNPGPSPVLIPSREHAAYERTDTTHAATYRVQTSTIRDATVTITQTQKESIAADSIVGASTLGAAASTSLIDDPSRYTLPAIPDDWVDLDHSTPAKSNEPVRPFKPDSDTPELPSTPTPSRPASVLGPPPPIDVLPDIPDIGANRASYTPDQIPLPESRAATVISVQPRSRSALHDTMHSRVDKAVPAIGTQIPLPESRAASEIGGVYDQPQPRSALRDSLRSRVDKAATEIGVDPARSLTPIAETQSLKSQRSWTSWARSKFGQSIDIDAPETPPKEMGTRGEPVGQRKPDVGDATQAPTTTPAQVDPPPNILTQPGDTPPLLLTAEPEPEPVRRRELPQPSKTDQLPASAGVDSTLTSPQGVPGIGDIAGPRKSSLIDLPAPSRTPPPPFTEFAGVPEDSGAGEGSAEQGPVVQDEALTELTEEQKAIEEKRKAFLSTQAQELEVTHDDLQVKLDKEDDPGGGAANAILSDLEDAEKTLVSIKARMTKKKFAGPTSDSSIREITVVNQSVGEVQFAVTSALMDMILKQNHVGPMTLKVVVCKLKSNKRARDAKDTVIAFANRHQFETRFETGTVHITF